MPGKKQFYLNQIHREDTDIAGKMKTIAQNYKTSYTFTKNSIQAMAKKGFDGNVKTTYVGGGQSHTHGDTGTVAAQTISVVQPYITCYMWKRTA